MQERLASTAHAIARGASVEAACRWNAVSAATYYRWKRETEATGEVGDASRARETRERVIAAARQVFLEQGFDASLLTIAQAAGVSRRTIYNLFGDRDHLFGEVVHALSIQYLGFAQVVDDEDLASALYAWARQQIRYTTDPAVIGIMKVALGESRDYPQLAMLAYALRANSGADTTTAAIARRLDREVAAGAIAPVDTTLAAQIFIGSCTAHLRHRALVGLPPGSEPEIAERVSLAVEFFLKGLGHKRPPRSA